MVDKLTTVRETLLGEQIGRLDDDGLVRLDRAVAVFPRPGLAWTTSPRGGSVGLRV